MARVLVLYYSSYGHIETMAGAVAEGAREAGAEVTIKRVPELVPQEVAQQSGYRARSRRRRSRRFGRDSPINEAVESFGTGSVSH